MNTEASRWEKLAAEFDEALRRDLAGGAGTDEGQKPVRTRGVVRVRGEEASSPEFVGPAPVVVVMTCRGSPALSAAEIRQRLQLETEPDLYVVVDGRHWAALEPREFNPTDQERGPEHELFLRNLKPDYVLVTAGGSPPSWCGEGTEVVEYS